MYMCIRTIEKPVLGPWLVSFCTYLGGSPVGGSTVQENFVSVGLCFYNDCHSVPLTKTIWWVAIEELPFYHQILLVLDNMSIVESSIPQVHVHVHVHTILASCIVWILPPVWVKGRLAQCLILMSLFPPPPALSQICTVYIVWSTNLPFMLSWLQLLMIVKFTLRERVHNVHL